MLTAYFTTFIIAHDTVNNLWNFQSEMTAWKIAQMIILSFCFVHESRGKYS